MRSALIVAGLLALAPVAPASAAVGVSIGINIPVYPRLVAVPGYPVYYAPGVDSNYFFYDGLYWDFDGTNWYSSAWYNGPWNLVDPYAVPVYLLRVPVRYYHHPPAWFRGWAVGGAPHWHEHWGASWAERRGDWAHWDNHHGRIPARAPLPTYQRNYAGERYPRAEEQARFHSQNYHYAPREQVVQQHYADHGYRAVQREEHRAVVRENRREERREDRREEHHDHR
jgi:hypothetical protein